MLAPPGDFPIYLVARHGHNQSVQHHEYGVLSGSTSPSEKAGSDQRLRGRYPIALELQYKLLNKGRVERVGVGQTLNISSGGVLFEAAGLLPSSGPVELTISWPFLLDGAVKLKLVMSGHIVRNDAKAIAVKVEHHEFRTTSRSLSEKPREGI